MPLISNQARPVAPLETLTSLRIFSAQLAAGLPIFEGARYMQDLPDEGSRASWRDIFSRLEASQSLSMSLAAHPKRFSPVTCALIGAGEQSGLLHEALAAVCDRLEALRRRARLERTLKRGLHDETTRRFVTPWMATWLVCVNMQATLRAGVPILDALKLCEADAPNASWRDALARVSARVMEGHGIGETLAQSGVASPAIILGLIASGEQQGTLDETLKIAATLCESVCRDHIERG